jgi:hypothetical protein
MYILNKRITKSFITIVVFALIIAFIGPQKNALANEQVEYDHSNVYMTQSEERNANELLSILIELDENVDLKDVTNNSDEDINSLSEEAKEFYISYQNALEEGQAKSQVQINDFLYNQAETSKAKSTYMASSSIGGVYKTKISNSTVQNILDIAGASGVGWGFAVAIAKKYGKSPTFASLIIAATVALGVYVLKQCNKKKKGIIITRVRVGASNSFYCNSQ